MSLVCSRIRLLSLFRATGLDTDFVVHPTLAKALADLPAGDIDRCRVGD